MTGFPAPLAFAFIVFGMVLAASCIAEWWNE